MGWPPVNSAVTRGQLLGCGNRLGRYCLLIFIAQRPKLSGRKYRLGRVPHVLHSESKGPRLVVQTGRFRRDKRLNHGQGLKGHLSPISLDRLGN